MGGKWLARTGFAVLALVALLQRPAPLIPRPRQPLQPLLAGMWYAPPLAVVGVMLAISGSAHRAHNVHWRPPLRTPQALDKIQPHLHQRLHHVTQWCAALCKAVGKLLAIIGTALVVVSVHTLPLLRP